MGFKIFPIVDLALFLVQMRLHVQCGVHNFYVDCTNAYDATIWRCGISFGRLVLR